MTPMQRMDIRLALKLARIRIGGMIERDEYPWMRPLLETDLHDIDRALGALAEIPDTRAEATAV